MMYCLQYANNGLQVEKYKFFNEFTERCSELRKQGFNVTTFRAN